MKKIVLIVCLLLFGSALVHAQNNGKYLYHTVEQGETLFGISREYGIQIAEIKDLNPELGSDLKLGQILLIPSIQREKIDTARIYTVKKGDTWYGIARSWANSNQRQKERPRTDVATLQHMETLTELSYDLNFLGYQFS